MALNNLDPRDLQRIFDENVKNAGNFLHQVTQHQIPFFERLILGFETLTKNWPKLGGCVISYEVTRNQLGLSALSVIGLLEESRLSLWSGNALSRDQRIVTEIEIAVSADGNVYIFKRDKKNHPKDYFPSHAAATVNGYNSRMLADVLSDLRAKLVMVDPDFIGKYIEQTSVSLSAGQGAALEQFTPPSFPNAAPR